MKKIIKFLTSIVMLTALLISCGGSKDSTEKVEEQVKKATVKVEEKAKKPTAKLAIVYSTGGLGDKSFNDSAKEGLERAVKELGIVYDEFEPKDPSAEAQDKLQSYAEKGEFDLIIATGFSMKDSLEAVAKEFPEQKFALIDEVLELPNVQSLMFKEQEGSYLVGALAAMMTKTNTIGFVGGLDVPVIKRFETGYIQGAKSVNPNIQIKVSFVDGPNAFGDPIAAKALTTSMIKNQKADVIFQVAGGSGFGVFNAAEENKVYAIGVDSDQDDVIKGVILTSMIKKVGNAVYNTTQEIIKGNFKPGVTHFGLAEDGVSTSNYTYTKDIIGAEKIARVEKLNKEIKEGIIKVQGIEYLEKIK